MEPKAELSTVNALMLSDAGAEGEAAAPTELDAAFVADCRAELSTDRALTVFVAVVVTVVAVALWRALLRTDTASAVGDDEAPEGTGTGTGTTTALVAAELDAAFVADCRAELRTDRALSDSDEDGADDEEPEDAAGTGNGSTTTLVSVLVAGEEAAVGWEAELSAVDGEDADEGTMGITTGIWVVERMTAGICQQS